VAYVKGLFLKRTFHTFLKIENDIHYDIFHKILTNTDLSEHTDKLRTMFFAKLDHTKHDIQSAIIWFEKASLTVKKIMVMVFYMEISYSTDQINQNEEKDTETETEEEVETETQEEYKLERQPEHSEPESEEEESEFEYELVTCGNCGNQWDGMAQCNCWRYDSTENTEEHVEAPQEPAPTSHSQDWMSTSHYGMCGQSCPCCRAEVGDTFGACPICKKN
jgi:chemotaxis protein histidine kinase CheA